MRDAGVCGAGGVEEAWLRRSQGRHMVLRGYSLCSALRLSPLPGGECYEDVHQGFQGGVRVSAMGFGASKAADIEAAGRRSRQTHHHFGDHGGSLVSQRLQQADRLHDSRTREQRGVAGGVRRGGGIGENQVVAAVLQRLRVHIVDVIGIRPVQLVPEQEEVKLHVHLQVLRFDDHGETGITGQEAEFQSGEGEGLQSENAGCSGRAKGKTVDDGGGV